MMVSKTVTIDFEDLKKIEIQIKDGKASNFPGYIQRAIKNQLREDQESD